MASGKFEGRGSSDSYTVIPMESFSAFRKAILAMKDLGTFVTLRLRSPTQLEVSSMDDFRATGLYTVVPVFRTNNMPKDAYGFLPATDMVTLASILKKHAGAIRLQHIAATNSFRITKLNSNHPILEPSLLQPPCLHPRLLDLVQEQNYYWLDMVSVDILTTCVNLSVGSAIIDVLLLSDGRMVWSNDHDLGKITVTKQLATKFHVASSTDTSVDHSKQVFVLCKTQAVIKFASKALTNSLVNCSQKNLKLGVPKCPIVPYQDAQPSLPLPKQPLVLKFFLSRPDIWGYFLMFPIYDLLDHSFDFPTQKPLSMHTPVSVTSTSSTGSVDSLDKQEVDVLPTPSAVVPPRTKRKHQVEKKEAPKQKRKVR